MITFLESHKENIIAQAAEAVIIKKGGNIVKRRIKKSYRIPEIDESLRKKRTKKEAKLIESASRIIPVPKIIKADESSKEIVMQFVCGKKLSDWLDKLGIETSEFHKSLVCGLDNSGNSDSAQEPDKVGQAVLDKAKNICRQIGESVAKLHDANIIHGDLTTSNMILNEKENKVYFIDFGLGFISIRAEDKAVDLHLLRQALEAKHFQHWKTLFEAVIKGYGKSKNANKTLLQLQKVEK